MYKRLAGALLWFILWPVIAIAQPLVPEAICDFDGAGRIMALTKPDGAVIRYQYGSQGRLTVITAPDSRTEYRYDKNGNCIEVRNNTGKTVYDYDPLDRLIKVTYDYPVLKKSVLYEYDPYGHITRTAIVSPSGAEEFYMSYDCDIFGNLRGIRTNDKKISYEYDSVNRTMTRILPKDIHSIYTYDSNGQIIAIEHKYNEDTLARFEYKYNILGLLETAQETVLGKNLTIQYQYDKANRLIRADYSDGKFYAYEYDTMGNRVSASTEGHLKVSAEYDPEGKLRSFGDTAFKYDAGGNTIGIKESRRQISLRYNSADLVEKIQVDKSLVQYVYSAEGYLIARTDANDTTAFLPDPISTYWHPLQAIHSNGIAENYLGISRTQMNGNFLYLEDRSGSTRLIIGPDGNIVSQRFYGPFGEGTISCDKAIDFGFAGLPFDSQSGFYLTMARVYAPELGRFLQIESKEIEFIREGKPEVSPYSYCRNDPVNFIDRNGTEAESVYKNTLGNDYADLKQGAADFYNQQGWLAHREADIGLGYAAVKSAYGDVYYYIEGQTKNFHESVKQGAAHLYNQQGWLAHREADVWIASDVAVSMIKDLAPYLSPFMKLGKVWFSPSSNERDWIVTTSELAIDLTLKAKLPIKASEPLRLWYPSGVLEKAKLSQPSVGEKIVEYIGSKIERYGVNISHKGILMKELRDTRLIGNMVNKTGRGIIDTGSFGKKNAKPIWEIIKNLKSGAPHIFEKQREVNDSFDKKGYTEPELRADKKAPNKIPYLESQHGKEPKKSDKKNDLPSIPPFPPDKFGGAGVPTEDALSNLGTKWQPKGVKFDKPAEFFGKIGAISGVHFDPETNQLSLIGDGNPLLPSVRLDDFIVALKIVYGGEPGETTDPIFSLDPEDPANPAGDWLQAVYGPGLLAGTHMGEVMFKADWVLKQYAFGVIADEKGNITGKRTSSLAGYKSYMELLSQNPFAQKKLAEGGSVCSRFWILPLEMKLAKSGNTLVFVRSTMQVETRRMEMVDGRLEDNPDNSDPVADEFAQFFTAHYDELAREAPVLEEVREAAKVVAIVKWLKEQGVGINDFKFDYKTIQHNDAYVKRIHSLSVTASTTWGMSGWVRLVGGVELSPHPVEAVSTTVSSALNSVISRDFSGPDATAVSLVQGETERFFVSSLPITQSSNDFIQQHPVITQEDVVYAFDSNHLAREAFDEDGNSVIFDYGKENSLTGVHFSTPQGWELHGALLESGKKYLRLHTPNSDDIVYDFRPDGYITGINVNNRPVSRFSWGKAGESVEIEHLKTVEEFPIGDISAEPKKTEKVISKETIVYGDNSLRYTRQNVGEVAGKPETISYTFTKDKLTCEFPGMPSISMERKNETTLIEKGSDGETTYEYNPGNGLLKKISYGNGDFVEFFPEDKSRKDTVVLRAKKENAVAEMAYGDDRIATRNFKGVETVYRYKDGLIQEIDSSSGKVAYHYDDLNRLSGVSYPDGSALKFAWSEGANVGRLEIYRQKAGSVK